MATIATTVTPARPHTQWQKTAAFILDIQRPDGAIPWSTGDKLDPWDHTEAAMALSTAGHGQAAEKAYQWLARNQLEDGSWHAHYFVADENPLRETNFVAYIATGVWHHYLITNDEPFLRRLYPCVQKAMHFVLRQQSEHGEIAWAVDQHGVTQHDALVTACSSILRSIDCACRIARALGITPDAWQSAGRRLRQTLLYKPERFDRTWESKARFSMDWYYPVLAGLYTAEQAQRKLAQRWDEFVVPDLGCRCVSDEPWVTMAETCELVIALVASAQHEKARALFGTLEQWCDQDGGYWTGYVFRDKALWPAEKTSWTAGAVLLAADAVFKLTPAATLFTQPLHGIDG